MIVGLLRLVLRIVRSDRDEWEGVMTKARLGFMNMEEGFNVVYIRS